MYPKGISIDRREVRREGYQIIKDSLPFVQLLDEPEWHIGQSSSRAFLFSFFILFRQHSQSIWKLIRKEITSWRSDLFGKFVFYFNRKMHNKCSAPFELAPGKPQRYSFWRCGNCAVGINIKIYCTSFPLVHAGFRLGSAILCVPAGL